MFRGGGILVRTKVDRLQWKRLYPNEKEVDEDGGLDYLVSFGCLHESDASWASVVEERRFSFDESSRHKALNVDEGQYQRIADYERRRYSIPVYSYTTPGGCRTRPTSQPWRTGGLQASLR